MITSCKSRLQTSNSVTNIQTINVTVTSDPTGAEVIVEDVSKGFTPITLSIPQNTVTAYSVRVIEPYDDYNLYKSYDGIFNLSKDETVSVWIERTSAEEQVTQSKANLEKQKEEQQMTIQEQTQQTDTQETSNFERQFSFSTKNRDTQSVDDITAYVSSDPNDPDKKLVAFVPLIDGTDGNLWLASLATLQEIYGMDRGMANLENAKIKYDSASGENYVCWDITNPQQEFCSFAHVDTETGKLFGMKVWVE
jgi:PEGA domain